MKTIKKALKKIKDNMKPDCIYAGKCSSEGIKCFECANNRKRKKDYYRPVNVDLTW